MRDAPSRSSTNTNLWWEPRTRKGMKTSDAEFQGLRAAIKLFSKPFFLSDNLYAISTLP